ncbi:hypothetical protein N8328_01665 [Crocinitomicaceae bacterium]|nr:hypothetical protein [Crocinitomicaceae bacterium]
MILLASQDLLRPVYWLETSGLAAPWPFHSSGILIFKKTTFHTFDDSRDWLQMDKAGHVYSRAHLSEASYRLFSWTGLPNKKSAFVGTLLGFGFQTTLELLDGRNVD